MLQAGYRISIASLAWTLVVGVSAIVAGVAGASLVLVVFGAIAMLDAVGSSVLIVHFRHAMRYEAISARRERIALLVVTIGMASVGTATIADSAFLLARHGGGRAPVLGIGLAAASVLALSALSVAKRRIAPRIPSAALTADGWVSGVGAALALVTLVGVGLQVAMGWWWLDPGAALVLGVSALPLSWVLGREERSGELDAPIG